MVVGLENFRVCWLHAQYLHDLKNAFRFSKSVWPRTNSLEYGCLGHCLAARAMDR